jgi:hypothetical protein
MSSDERRDISDVLEASELWILALVRLAIATGGQVQLPSDLHQPPEYEIVKVLRRNLLEKLIEATRET